MSFLGLSFWSVQVRAEDAYHQIYVNCDNLSTDAKILLNDIPIALCKKAARSKQGSFSFQSAYQSFPIEDWILNGENQLRVDVGGASSLLAPGRIEIKISQNQKELLNWKLGLATKSTPPAKKGKKRRTRPTVETASGLEKRFQLNALYGQPVWQNAPRESLSDVDRQAILARLQSVHAAMAGKKLGSFLELAGVALAEIRRFPGFPILSDLSRLDAKSIKKTQTQPLPSASQLQFVPWAQGRIVQVMRRPESETSKVIDLKDPKKQIHLSFDPAFTRVQGNWELIPAPSPKILSGN